MYIKICKTCGSSFYSETNCRTTCSRACRNALKRKSKRETLAKKGECDQICFTCQRATGKNINSVVCPWAHSLKPVKGWDATEIIIEEEGCTPYQSYDIHKCPLYMQDEDNTSDMDLLYRWIDVKKVIKNMI